MSISYDGSHYTTATSYLSIYLSIYLSQSAHISVKLFLNQFISICPSPQIYRTLLNILAVLNNAGFCMASVLPQIYISFCLSPFINNYQKFQSTHILHTEGKFSATVIVVRNGIVNRSSNSGRVLLHFSSRHRESNYILQLGK